MDRKTRIAVAAGILVIGLVGALAFRRDGQQASAPTPAAPQQIVVRRESAATNQPPAAHAIRPDFPDMAPLPAIAGKTPPPIAPLDHLVEAETAPPFLTAQYPDFQPRRPENGPLRSKNLAQTPPKTRSHRIVDGDSLEALAEKYLGSAERVAELIEANREVLVAPGVLPIGKTLTIPDGKQLQPATGPAPLVPVKKK